MGDRSVLVEIVAYAPTVFFHCTHCEIAWQETGFSRGVRAEQIENGLPPDLLEEYRSLSDWAQQLLRAYGDRLVVKVVDAASLEGVVKTLRHGLRRYPAILINGRGPFYAFEAAEEQLKVEGG